MVYLSCGKDHARASPRPALPGGSAFGGWTLSKPAGPCPGPSLRRPLSGEEPVPPGRRIWGASPLVCQLNADRLPPLPPAVSKKRSGSAGSFGVDEIKTGRGFRPVFISSTAFSLPAYQCLPRTAVDLRIRTDRQTDHSHLFPSPSAPG